MKESATVHLTVTFRRAHNIHLTSELSTEFMRRCYSKLHKIQCMSDFISERNGTYVVTGSHVRSTVLWYTCYLHSPPPHPTPPPATTVTLVFEDKRQLIIKQLILSFSHPVSVSSSRTEGGLIFQRLSSSVTRKVYLCVYVVYRNKMWGRDSDQHICFSSS